MRPLSRWLRFGFWAVIFLFPKDSNSQPVFWGVGTLIYLPPGTPEKLVEILRQAFRSSLKIANFTNNTKNFLTSSNPTHAGRAAETCRGASADIEVVRVFKTIAVMDPFPPRR
jgi:hypothetical protein